MAGKGRHVYATDEEWVRWQAEATARGVSLSELIRMALERISRKAA